MLTQHSRHPVDSRWLVLAIVFFARTGVGFQFIAVAALMTPLRQALSLGYGEAGILLGIFMLAGVFLSVPSAMVAGKLGGRLTLQLGLLALMAAGIITAASDSFAIAVIGRAVGGVGAVFITVTGAKLLTDRFHGREMATAMSILGVSWPVGIAAGIALIPMLGSTVGWQAAFLITALVPLVALAGLAFMPSIATTSGGARRMNDGASAFIWSIQPRELKLVIAGGLAWPLMSSGGYVVFSSYAPELLVERGATPAMAALTISLLSWLIIVTIPAGGILADRLGKSDLLFWSGCLVAAAAIAMVPLAGPIGLWVLVSASLGLTVGVVMALPDEMLSEESRATGLGVFYSLYYLGTATLPPLAGWLLDITGSTAVVVWFSAVCLVLAPLSLWAFRSLQTRVAGTTV